PLDRELHNGDVVEVITRSNASPSLDWLKFVKSAHTRGRLRSHFRRLSRDKDAARGREMIEKELRSLSLDPKTVFGEDRLAKITKEYDGVESPTELLARVGSGLVLVPSVVNRLRGIAPPPNVVKLPTVTPGKEGKLQLSGFGLEGILVQRARCCSPIPGDDIVGYVSRGRGIVLHRVICPNAQSYATNEPERSLPYEWPVDGSVYDVPLRIVAIDRTGLVSDITTVFAESKSNMTAISTRSKPNGTADIDISLQVTGTENLAHVMAKIANFSDILSCLRAFGRPSR
ncbi:MAG: (p)ppGpp synthetase, partial [Armatimonadota bacterium]